MSRPLQTEIDKLKKQLLFIGAMVEESLQKAIRSVRDRDQRLARDVIDGDDQVDRAEVELEEECLKVLALHQPVAGDLRLIVAVLKINNDLERIGDLAVNVAERAASLAERPPLAIPFDVMGMSRIVGAMLKDCLDSLVNLDSSLADRVCRADDEVDDLNRDAYGRIMAAIRENPDRIDSYIHLLSVSRYLERIADHSTNIAEDVIYLTEGEIVRHRH